MGQGSTNGSSAIAHALAKLIDVVEEENEALRGLHITSHANFTDRKNQALRELMAAQRMAAGPHTVQGSQPLLQRLGEALQVNSKLLKHHISAVGEVSDIIVAGLRDADSDGTYSRECSSYGRR